MPRLPIPHQSLRLRGGFIAQTRAWLGGAIAWLGLALLPMACDRADGPLTVSGRIEVDDIHVGSRVGGRVERVAVHEGDTVDSGTLLVELESRELTARLEESRAARDQAKAELDLLLAGTRREEIEQGEAILEQRREELRLREEGFRREEVREAAAQVERARADMELARSELARYEKLRADGVIGQSELDTRRAAMQTAEAQHAATQERLRLLQSGARPQEIAQARDAVAAAEAQLRKLLNGARPEEIAAARAALAAAEARIALTEEQLREMRIVSPAAARIETLELEPGDLIAAGQGIATLHLRDSLYVRCYVPQIRLGLVQVGEEVEIAADAWPGERFKGRVRHVNSEAEFTPRNVQTTEKRADLVFEVKADILNAADKLRPGMYADVIITE